MTRLVRSAALSNYIEVAEAVGLRPFRMIASVGLPPACLTDPEMRVPALAVTRLLEASALRSSRPDFGLLLADRRSLSNLGMLALLIKEQPTIRKALGALVGYVHLHSEALAMSLAEQDGTVTLGLTVDVERSAPVRYSVELALGFIHSSLRQLIGKRWRPQAVCFMHPAPSRLTAHHKFFGSELRFNEVNNCIICRATDIDVAMPSADPAMAKHVQRYLDTLAARPSATMHDDVRACILAMLPSGLCTAEAVAKRLGVDRRTIHRHLSGQGQTFKTLLDDIRSDLATQHIGNRRHSMTAIAELLGFSATSAFSRWFREHHGCSASEWRGRGENGQPEAQHPRMSLRPPVSAVRRRATIVRR